jgi:hypothetical protein
MFYADLKSKPDAVFKRLTGVRPATFLEMCQALETHLSRRGRTPKLCREDRLLLMLMYWREYRTFVHIGQTYGLSESAVCRTVHTVETALLRCGQFTLPGKKALTKKALTKKALTKKALTKKALTKKALTKKALTKKALTKSDVSFEVIVVDATECPLERPKKNNGIGTAARRSATLKKRRLSPTQRPSAS